MVAEEEEEDLQEKVPANVPQEITIMPMAVQEKVEEAEEAEEAERAEVQKKAEVVAKGEGEEEEKAQLHLNNYNNLL